MRRVIWAVAVLLAFAGSAALVAVLSGTFDGEPAPVTAPGSPGFDSSGVPLGADLSGTGGSFSVDPESPGPRAVEDASPAYTWSVRSIGGGGWVKGMEIHPSGEPVIARTDVGGAYRYDRATRTWQQLLLADRVQDPKENDYAVDSVALAPTDPDRIYLAAGESDDNAGPGSRRGRVLVSRDGGETWTSSNQPVVTHGNGLSRNGGERMAVAPDDADDVWLGGSEGLWRSRDGGVSFEPVATAPRGNASIVDQRGVEWVVTGPGVVYIGVSGAGVFHSVDDGASWELLWEVAGRPFDAELDGAGVLWAVSVDDRTVHRYDPATGEITVVEELSGEELRGLAVGPDGNQVVVAALNHLWRSTDGGASWRRLPLRFECPSIPWMDTYDFTLFTGSSPELDPLDPGTLWIPEGFGIWAVPDIAAGEAVLECRVDGVEEIVINDLVVPESDVVVAASWDRALFRVPPEGASGAVIGPSNRLNSGWDLATTAAQPGFVAAVVADARFCCEADGEAYRSGFSGDGGRSWVPFGSYAAGTHPDELRFGNIAVDAADPDVMVWLPTWNGALHRTTDRGQTWERVLLPGTEERRDEDGGYNGGSHFEYYLQREILVADPVTGGRFYLFHADLGLYRSDDGGASWQVVSADGLPAGWTVGWFNAQLSAVPGEAGHLLYSPGFLLEGAFPLFESTDAGETWTAIEGTSEVDVVGYGAPLDGSSSPTVYLSGRVDGRRGIYRSSDMMASWERIADAPAGLYKKVNAITGDPEIPGRVYVGFGGTSIVQGDEA